MSKPTFKRMGAFIAVTFLTLMVLTACSTPAKDQAAADVYIRANISDLSPTPAVLGGTFQVTDIEWEDSDTAVVSYEDGHIALKARTDIVKDDDGVKASTFAIIDAGTESSKDDDASGSSVATGTGSTSSIVERPRAKDGELCGGIAGIECDFGMICMYEGAYPDAAGTCAK